MIRSSTLGVWGWLYYSKFTFSIYISAQNYGDYFCAVASHRNGEVRIRKASERALISRPVAKHVVHYGVINACTKDENRKIRASGLDIKQLFCQVYLDCDKLLIPLQWPLILQAIHTCFAMPIHIFKRCYIFGTHNMWKHASHDTQTILQIHRCEIVFSAIVNLCCEFVCLCIFARNVQHLIRIQYDWISARFSQRDVKAIFWF